MPHATPEGGVVVSATVGGGGRGLDDVELGAGQAAVRRDGLDRAVERIVARAALECLGRKLRVALPIGDRGVVAEEAARAAQQVALEVEGLDRVLIGVQACVGRNAGAAAV